MAKRYGGSAVNWSRSSEKSQPTPCNRSGIGRGVRGGHKAGQARRGSRAVRGSSSSGVLGGRAIAAVPCSLDGANGSASSPTLAWRSSSAMSRSGGRPSATHGTGRATRSCARCIPNEFAGGWETGDAIAGFTMMVDRLRGRWERIHSRYQPRGRTYVAVCRRCQRRLYRARNEYGWADSR